MNSCTRYKQLKSMLNMEMETEREIRSDLEEKIAKNIMRTFEMGSSTYGSRRENDF